jgi:hypothetical protein
MGYIERSWEKATTAERKKKKVELQTISPAIRI